MVQITVEIEGAPDGGVNVRVCNLGERSVTLIYGNVSSTVGREVVHELIRDNDVFRLNAGEEMKFEVSRDILTWMRHQLGVPLLSLRASILDMDGNMHISNCYQVQ